MIDLLTKNFYHQRTTLRKVKIEEDVLQGYFVKFLFN